jgi:hypothetical protein
VIVPAKIDERDREHVRYAQFVLVYGRAERDGPLVNVIARRVEGFGPEVLPGTAAPDGAREGPLRAPATAPTGRGPMATLAPHPGPGAGPRADARDPHAAPGAPEAPLRYRSHDFR